MTAELCRPRSLPSRNLARSDQVPLKPQRPRLNRLASCRKLAAGQSPVFSVARGCSDAQRLGSHHKVLRTADVTPEAQQAASASSARACVPKEPAPARPCSLRQEAARPSTQPVRDTGSWGVVSSAYCRRSAFALRAGAFPRVMYITSSTSNLVHLECLRQFNDEFILYWLHNLAFYTKKPPTICRDKVHRK